MPGNRWRARYACDPLASRGRRHAEADSPTRSQFQRDRDRIVHASAFRRLAHKTQVFVFHEGDHYRTRLTHTIEVSQVSRALARALGLDEDLSEALALAHDLGHTPFGHTGEDALAACMAPYGGFDHNAQALRVVTSLERRYAGHDGLNLTWEMLEGLVKHNGPLLRADGTPTDRHAAHGIPAAVAEVNADFDMRLDSFASGEAQAAAIADDIAYDSHDIDDGLRAGFFAIDDLREVEFLRSILEEIDALHPGLDEPRRIHELTRRVITRMVEDVIVESRRRIKALNPRCADDIRAADGQLVSFSPELAAADRAIKRFLFANMYRHERIKGVRADAENMVGELFAHYLADPQAMPQEWSVGLKAAPVDAVARRIADYIAGMTDAYAMKAHARIFEGSPTLRLG